MRSSGLVILLLGFDHCNNQISTSNAPNKTSFALFEWGKDFAIDGDYNKALEFYSAGLESLELPSPLIDKWIYAEIGRAQFELATQSNDHQLALESISMLDYSLSIPSNDLGVRYIFDNDSARVRKELFVDLHKIDKEGLLEPHPFNLIANTCYFNKENLSSCELDELEYFFDSKNQ